MLSMFFGVYIHITVNKVREERPLLDLVHKGPSWKLPSRGISWKLLPTMGCFMKTDSPAEPFTVLRGVSQLSVSRKVGFRFIGKRNNFS